MHKEPTPSTCPGCGGPRVAAIFYGLPDNSDESLNRALEDGKVVLGGCELSEENPEWHCLDCEHEWGLFEYSDSHWVGY